MDERPDNPFSETVRQAEERVERSLHERGQRQLEEEGRRTRISSHLAEMGKALGLLCRDFSKATGAEVQEFHRGDDSSISFYIQIWTLSIHIHLSAEFPANDCPSCGKRLAREQAFLRASRHDPRHNEQKGFGDWPEKEMPLLDFRPEWLSGEVKAVYLRYCETPDFLEYRKVKRQAGLVLRQAAASYGLWALAGILAAFQWWAPAAVLAGAAGGCWPVLEVRRAWLLKLPSWPRRLTALLLEGALAPLAFLLRLFFLPDFLRHLPRLRHPRPFSYSAPGRTARF